LLLGISIFYGIPIKFCNTLANNLKSSILRFRTALSDSISMYQHSEATPVHGTGLGLCVSPASWMMQSSFMMNIMDDIAQGMKMVNVDTSKEDIKQIREGFVDDISNHAKNDTSVNDSTTISSFLN
jgi:hypothetical protein